MNNEKKGNCWTILKNNYYMLKYIFRFTPGLIVYMLAVKVLTAIMQVINSVFTITFILNAVIEQQPLSYVISYMGLYLVVSVILLLLSNFYEEVYYKKKKLVLVEKMQMELYEKAITIDIECFDNPEFYNDFVIAMEQSEERALQVLIACGEFVQIIMTLLSTSMIIVSLDGCGIFIVLVSFVINLFCNFQISKIIFKRDIKGRKYQRKRDYTNRIFYQTTFAKDIRISNVEELLIQNFKENNRKLINNINFYAKKIFVLEIINTIFSKDILFNGIFMAVLVYKVIVLKSITYSVLVGVISGIGILQNNFTKLAELMTDFSLYSSYIDKFLEFQNYKSNIEVKEGKKNCSRSNGEIIIKNVSFSYPYSKRKVLKNINMVIRPGEKIAIVGYNGSGKSTLIKLLLRLYEVEEGKIFFDGNDIRDYKVTQYRKLFGTVFQDFHLFATSTALLK